MGVSSEDLFDKMVRLSSALPWSDRDRVHSGLARLLLEHILMTAIASVVSSYAGDTSDFETHLRVQVKRILRAATSESKVELKHTDGLVDMYVDALVRRKERRKVQSKGHSCSWIMGCPATHNREMLNTPFRIFASLEDDHIFPSSRSGRYSESGLGQKLCRYHNSFWKGQHIALALDDYWLQ